MSPGLSVRKFGASSFGLGSCLRGWPRVSVRGGREDPTGGRDNESRTEGRPVGVRDGGKGGGRAGGNGDGPRGSGWCGRE